MQRDSSGRFIRRPTEPPKRGRAAGLIIAGVVVLVVVIGVVAGGNAPPSTPEPQASVVAEQTAAPDTATPNPDDMTPPPWLQIAPGSQGILADIYEPESNPTIWTCNDAYEYEHYSTNNELAGCVERRTGQIVTIKQYDSWRDVLYIKGVGWSAVSSPQALQPLIPIGTMMDCQDETDSMTLYSHPSDQDAGYDLRDGLIVVQVTHGRGAGVWNVPVRVVKGYGLGRSGYIKSDDLSKCVISGTKIQVIMKPPD